MTDRFDDESNGLGPSFPHPRHNGDRGADTTESSLGADGRLRAGRAALRRGKLVPAALALAVMQLAGCDRGPEIPPEVRQRKVEAYSTACAARELLARANDDLETLEATAAAADPSTPEGQVTLSTSQALLEFSRAYQHHAELRSSAFSHVDSALNRSATPADSARYMQLASQFTIRTPIEGTVEANVMASFERNMAEILTNPDHPCNWDLPF